ncbi:DMT family transporter [Alteromonas confluentis]|nr:DMT family transporter [Alteromonas confluentis]
MKSPAATGLSSQAPSLSLSISAARQVWAVILLALAIIVLGGNWPVMKTGLQYVSPLWFSALRFATGCACLFALQLLTGKCRLPTKRDFPLIASVGLVQMMMFTALGSVAMQSVDAGRSAVLGYTTPLWVMPVAVFVLGERLTRRQTIGTLVGLAGVLVMLNPMAIDWQDSNVVAGNMLLLFCSLCWAMTILHVRHYKGDSSAYELAPWQMLTATLPLFFMARHIEGPFDMTVSANFWSVMAYVGPLATAFCFVIINSASRWMSSSAMSNAMLGVPVSGLLLSVIFLGETLSVSLAAGGAIILCGIAIVSVRASRTKTKKA